MPIGVHQDVCCRLGCGSLTAGSGLRLNKAVMSADHEERLRRMAVHDDHLIQSMLAIPPGHVEASGLDAKSCALVRLGALLALDAAYASYHWGCRRDRR